MKASNACSFLAALFAAGLMAALSQTRAESLTPYPLAICIVTGDKLDKDPIVFSYQGREIKTCCSNCVDDFYKDPAGFAEKIEEAAKRLSAN